MVSFFLYLQQLWRNSDFKWLEKYIYLSNESLMLCNETYSFNIVFLQTNGFKCNINYGLVVYMKSIVICTYADLLNDDTYTEFLPLLQLDVDWDNDTMEAPVSFVFIIFLLLLLDVNCYKHSDAIFISGAKLS